MVRNFHVFYSRSKISIDTDRLEHNKGSRKVQLYGFCRDKQQTIFHNLNRTIQRAFIFLEWKGNQIRIHHIPSVTAYNGEYFHITVSHNDFLK